MTDDALLAAALPQIKAEEGCRLAAYQDTRGIWTIGYGRADSGITKGMTCTQAQAERWLTDHVETVIAGLDANLPWWRRLSIITVQSIGRAILAGPAVIVKDPQP